MSEYFDLHLNRINPDVTITDRYNTRNSDKVDPRQQLRNLKNLIDASVNLALHDKSCGSDDSFLNRFLYAKKMRSDEALQLLINYFNYKKDNRDILKGLSIFDNCIQQAIRDGNPSVLTQRDRRGRKVLTFTAAHWDSTKYSLKDIYRALLLTLDKLLEDVQNQALGFVVIVDWTNFTLKQSTQLQPRILSLIIKGLQDCMPIKFKGIHHIAQPWYVDGALVAMKPFLNDKTKRRTMIHGTNLTTLHNLVSKHVLPPDLGGEGPSVNTLDWYHHLLESSQSATSPKTYRLIEITVYSKMPSPPTSNCSTVEHKKCTDNQNQNGSSDNIDPNKNIS